ncbi:hypothetical protein DdX_01112 [Ditylenchus destructor]|uniref:Secreted protein n=1 Tax=Ditylenchus destructor TaxID=166010 RepID=A0AAD4NGD2_9BILA|nr:hypothetical protein DdX_01112 [Ditylenchus destructor]
MTGALIPLCIAWVNYGLVCDTSTLGLLPPFQNCIPLFLCSSLPHIAISSGEAVGNNRQTQLFPTRECFARSALFLLDCPFRVPHTSSELALREHKGRASANVFGLITQV